MSPQSTIFDRRSTRTAFELSRNVPTITVPISSTPTNSPVSLKRPTEGHSRKSTVTGFLPLPPISASPVCTPTTSTSSRDIGFVSDLSDSPSTDLSNESYTAAVSRSGSSLSQIRLTSPQWISIPPTPPPKLFKHSVTCVIKRSQSSVLLPSSSFPAFRLPHAPDRPIQRRNTVPTMSMSTYAHARSSSDLYFSIGRRRPKTRTEAANMTSPITATSTVPHQVSHVFAPPQPLFDVAHEVAMDLESEFAGGRMASASTVRPSTVKKKDRENFKDNIRKYHALLELLSTEVAYLEDLRVLVSIYLRQIPTLTLKRTPSSSSAFGRNSSFSALSRASSSVHLGNGVGKSSLDTRGLQPPINTASAKEPVRHIFKNSEIDALTRNAEQVLQFHEHFVEELRAAMAPCGFRMETLSERSSDDVHEELPPEGSTWSIDAGIEIVSTKFATEASRFASYEQFCAGHPEAMDILRRVQHAHSIEWEAFEQKCGASVYELLNGHSSSDDNFYARDIERKSKSRRSSIASIDGSLRYARSRSNSLAKDKDRNKESRNRSRLTFMDYLIKPVQRICKYPLLLDQLKTNKALSESTSRSDVVVESATQAMRHVASAVDEARRRQDLAIRSSLIASRLVYSPVIPPSFQMVLQTLTPSFLSSLGVCHLAGSLDVIHQRSSKSPTSAANIHVKYLGAFLYVGGYFILAKIKGKTYEPRHWFRLCDFKIAESEGTTWLPCSFRLSCKGHEFELAAACQREKEVWLTAIRESLAYPMSNWINEPITSIYVDGKGEMIPSIFDSPFEAIIPLPTVESIPEVASFGCGDQPIEKLVDSLPDDPPSRTTKKFTKGIVTQIPEVTSVPSRRSSIASFQVPPPPSPEYETFIIRRNLPTARTQIDAGLHDVISDACLDARATSQEEELFQAPSTIPPKSPSRSKATSRPSTSSGLNRLRKHESVRVPRKKNLVQVSDDSRVNYASRAKSLSNRSRPQKLNLRDGTSDAAERLSLLFTLDSSKAQYPPSFSGCSSSTLPSNPPSHMGSPVLNIPSFTTAAPSEPDSHKTRPSSFVGSVRSLFVSRPQSPMWHSAPAVPTQVKPSKLPSENAFKRWIKSSLAHRRTLSAPDSPQDGQTLAHSVPPLDFGEPLTLVSSPDQI